LYTPDEVGKLQTWDVMHGDIIRLLHPGPQPDNLNNIGEFASSTYKGIFEKLIISFYLMADF
jgi:hypothetical protein